jgi:hypothetical protein
MNPRGDPYVKGQIAIEGEFTRAEWEKIREMFIAMGLLQLKRGHRLSTIFPSRQEILEAYRDNKLRELAEKYPGFNYDQSLPRHTLE